MQSLCDDYGFSLRNLAAPGVLVWDRPTQAVTFVENHDVARSSPIINDKLLAYAFILTHEGYPCVFWQDYFNWNLGQPGNLSGIAALVQAHEKYAAGATQVLYVDDDLYHVQRTENRQPARADLCAEQRRHLARSHPLRPVGRTRTL